MSTQLSNGLCARLSDPAASADDTTLFGQEHTVQFLSIKMVGQAPTSAQERYRIIISDGTNFLQAMLATQLNHLVQQEVIKKNTIAVLEKMTCNFVQDKRLIIILALRVVQKDAEKIGSPVAVPAPETTPTNAVSAPAASSSAAATSSAANSASRSGGGAQRNGGRHHSVFPIEGLSPYQNNWTIRARVTQKSDIKTWSNQRGEGKVFNVTLMDESGEIRANAFNHAVDEMYDRLEENKVYFISKARVQLAKKKFSNVQNDYELTLEKNSEVEECHEVADMPMMKYNFQPLSDLPSIAPESIVDVIGVVKEVSPMATFTSKAGRDFTKRDLTLADKSQHQIRLTLFGKQAESFPADMEDAPIVAIKGAKVSEFSGRSLSGVSSTTLQVNPDIEECHALRGWYDAFGAKSAFSSVSAGGGAGGTGGGFRRDELRSLMSVKESEMGMSDKPEYFSAQATVMHIRGETIAYPACKSEGCNKKVTQIGDGWRCEKCDRSFEKPEYRYIFSMAVADYSGQAWFQGFNEAGNVLFNMTADELMDIKERDDSEYNTHLAKANCGTFNFSCRAKQDTFNDQTRVRYSISRMNKLDYKEESQYLLELLRSPWAQ